MDRLSQLRRDAGGSGDSTLDTTSPPSEAFMSANESTSKYFSLSDSTFDITPIKDVSLATASADTDGTITDPDELISNLSPIGKKDVLSDFKIGKQIEAANILSGGVDIFEENDNSFDGDELVIDDNVELEEKSNLEKSDLLKTDDSSADSTLVGASVASKDTEVVLQIDGKNVNAIDIGNGLYLYRKDGQEELAAVQIIEGDEPQPSFKFLKVRENAEGNLEVYEEIEIEISKEVPTQKGKSVDKNAPLVPIKDIKKVITESSSNKVAERINESPQKETATSEKPTEEKETAETKEVNFNGKMMKFSESRKSPVIGSFTPMTYHSTPNKEGKPLTKTMVDLHLHPSRHSENAKKTIEVHTDTIKPKSTEVQSKGKDGTENVTSEVISAVSKSLPKASEDTCTESEVLPEKTTHVTDKQSHNENNTVENVEAKSENNIEETQALVTKPSETTHNIAESEDTLDSAEDITGQLVIDEELEIVKEIPLVENQLVSTEENVIEAFLPSDPIILPVPVSEREEITRDESATKTIENKSMEEVKTPDAAVDKQEFSDVIMQAAISTDTKDVGQSAKTETEAKVESTTPLEIDEDEGVPSKTLLDNVSVSVVHETTSKFENTTPMDIDVVDFITKMPSDESRSSQTQESENVKINSVTHLDTDQVDNIPLSEALDIIDSINEKQREEMLTSNILPGIMDKSDNKSVQYPAIVGQKENEASTLILSSATDSNKICSKEVNRAENTNKSVEVDKKLESLEKPKEANQDKIESNKVAEERSHVPITPILIHPVKSSEALVVANNKADVALKATNVDSKLHSKDVADKPISKTEDKIVVNVKDSTSKIAQSNSNVTANKIELIIQKEPTTKPATAQTSDNNNYTAVPFGKWTDVNRQEFLNKFKEVKAPVNSNTKQIKNSNDLNRRDVLNKYDSQRQQTIINNATAKAQETKNAKSETVFTNKVVSTKPESKIPSTKPESKIPSTKPEPKIPSTKPESKIPPTKPEPKIPSTKPESKIPPTKPEPKIPSTKPESKIPPTKPEHKIPSTKPESKIPPTKPETKIPVKNESGIKHKPIVSKNSTKPEIQQNASSDQPSSSTVSSSTSGASSTKTETSKRRYNAQELIDKTIEDMLHRVVSNKSESEVPTAVEIQQGSKPSASKVNELQQTVTKPPVDDKVSIDDIEMKMNELHGIPFVERPAHELPKLQRTEVKTYSKADKEKALNKAPENSNVGVAALASEPKVVPENIIDIDSEEEVIEHEPITGDMDVHKKNITTRKPAQLQIKPHVLEKNTASAGNKDVSKREDIITENEFDKFARRNSITYENCLTVKFDGKEPDNAVQAAKEKDIPAKILPKNEPFRIDPKAKLSHKQLLRHNIPSKSHNVGKLGAVAEDPSNKNYQSKLHIAYQTALTAKRQVDRPITIIEDKPVKVIFMDANSEFYPTQLDVQGKELSPAKKPGVEAAAVASLTVTTTEPVELGMFDAVDENKQQDKAKTKHQRKQVLTPVEAPEIELIQPSDIGFETSPKKKRKIEDNKTDKNLKNLVHKKSYLLGRNTADDKSSKVESPKDTTKETINRIEDMPERKDTASAIDSLVKAAELLETQNQAENSRKAGRQHLAENVNHSIASNPESQPNTPVKRGRGRPRKYPLPEGATDNKQPSPQKKPRLIDAKPVKQDSISEDDSEDDGEIIQENWTMGKINENIVCPICNKLFRSENVVFKHVKHCTGDSPNRSESDKRSPRRGRQSQESEDMEIDEDDKPLKTPIKRKSKESITKSYEDKDDVIVIEDTPVKEKPGKHDKEKEDQPKKATKTKVPQRVNNLVCEICGKTFRQLSYLVSHKLQHKKDDTKKVENESQDTKSQVYSCEVCKKEFRKLHHLVQHRIIHNPESMSSRTLRKSSSEQGDKNDKDQTAAKQIDDPSAAFRCEPCDKSFRKLHHLVEHRETHDGINRQKIAAPAQAAVELPPPPQCDICKKTFRKLHHLIEHKEQHIDTSSEKSDDKSVKSTLSTKDIIHECSLCYMVFPNEHSLNKHSIICQKKKRQSKAANKEVSESESLKDEEVLKSEEVSDEKETPKETAKTVTEEIISDDVEIVKEKETPTAQTPVEVKKVENVDNPTIIEVKPTENVKPAVKETIKPAIKQTSDVSDQKENEVNPTEYKQIVPAKRILIESEGEKSKGKEVPVVPEKLKKVDAKTQDTPKKKTPLKDKVAPTVTKRQKTIDVPLPVVDEVKLSVESSDDDEVRYMFNTDYKVDESSEGKTFMKVRASKRNSLQIERPNSRSLFTRRTSLQHPPKIPRLKPRAIVPKLTAAEPKPKPIEVKSKSTETKPIASQSVLKHIPELEVEAELFTDSDDSDVKYSFPKTVPENVKLAPEQTLREKEKKVPRKSMAEKRKSLSGIAKRKSLGKAIFKHKVNPSPAKPFKKRIAEIEHRCDCGQLFSSAALLSRHTSLAHTPPRIRRRRSPPPDTNAKTTTDTADRKSGVAEKSIKQSSVVEKSTRKSSVAEKSTRKSSVTEKLARKSSVLEKPTKATRKTSVAENFSRKSTVSDRPTRKSSAAEASNSNEKSEAETSISKPGRKSSVKSEVETSTKKPGRKSSLKSEVETSTRKPGRKSSVKSEVETSTKKPGRKSCLKSEVETSTRKPGRKSSVNSEVETSTRKPGRKSSVKTEVTPPTETRKSLKSDKSEAKPSTVKTRRSAAHKGVPVPEKMRKLMQKSEK